MDQFNHLEAPLTFAEAEKLVQQFYLPDSPQEIFKIQNILQKIQKSPEGWRFADSLLESNDEKARFFGALTFTIKIKSDMDSLSDGDTPLLLDRLLAWLLRLVNAGEKPLVLRKVCSSLIAYFLSPSDLWEHCVRHLICCFFVDTVVPRQSLSQYPSTAELLGKFTQLQRLTTLWFCMNLVEELGKTDFASIQTFNYHKKVIADLDDVVVLLRAALDFDSPQDLKVAEEGIKCYQSWVMYAHRAWLEKAIELGPLRVLTPLALHHLSIEGMYDVTVEFFTDVLTNFPAFLIDSDYVLLSAVLSSTSARGYVATLKQGNVSDSDSIMFAKLLFAYGDAAVQDLAQKFQDPNLKQIMSYLLDLLSCDAYVGAEDQVCQLCLEFWTTFTEFIIDSIFAVGEQRPPWMENARRYIPEVIRACWSKIQMPPQEVFSTWDSEARDLFKEFRSDVKDILQSSYTLLGVKIFDEFAQLALESLNNHAWLHLEATLFCLNALSDSISDEDCVDKILTSLFGSSMFADMMSINSVPAATRQTAVSLIINYTTFFERQTTYLPSMLNFLFESLKSPTLANVAAKAIHSSCWACRKPLCPEIAAFLHQYEILLTWEGVEGSTKEKVLGAIAAIIQALPSEGEKMGPLNVLLNFVEGDVRTCMSLLKEDQHEDAQAFGVFALRCLVNIGKASQTPDEVVIDLDTNGMQTVLWTQGHWAAIQARIIHLMGLVIVPMSNDSQVMEAACQILRTGYKESSPGPFVFPPSVTENLVVTSHLKTARLDYVLDTAGALLSRHANRPMIEVNNASLTFLIHILSLISAMNSTPTIDPEVASSCIDLAEKLVPHYLRTLISEQTRSEIPTLLQFTLHCLAESEIMPKRSAANFWASIMQTYDSSSEVQVLMKNIWDDYGPQLSYILVMNIGGRAARSDLDVIAEPLKKLVYHQPRAKTWLSDALSNSDFPSQNVGATEKRMWLEKIIKLRAAKGTNQLIKEFWMVCRGTNLSFGS